MAEKSLMSLKKQAEDSTKLESALYIQHYESSNAMDLSKLKLDQTQLLLEQPTVGITVLQSKGKTFFISVTHLNGDLLKELSLPQKIESYPTRSKSWGQSFCEFWILALEKNDLAKQFEVVETIEAELQSKGYQGNRWESLIWLIRGSDYVLCTLLNHPLIEKFEIWLDKFSLSNLFK